MTTRTPESIAEDQQRGWAQAVADVCAERDKLREEVKALRAELDNERLAKAGLLRANDSLAASASRLQAQATRLKAEKEETLRLNADMAARFGALMEERERLLFQVEQLKVCLKAEPSGSALF
jgi:septation ring formation regulator EzrA